MKSSSLLSVVGLAALTLLAVTSTLPLGIIAQETPDPVFGQWVSTPDIDRDANTAVRFFRAGAVAFNDGMLLVGGQQRLSNGTFASVASIRFSTLDTLGQVGPVVSNLTTPALAPIVVAYQSHIFVFVDQSQGSRVERFSYLGNGQYTPAAFLGPLPAPVDCGDCGAGAAIVVDDFMYLFGANSTVHVTQLNPSGTLSQWIRLTDTPGVVRRVQSTAGALFAMDRQGFIHRASLNSPGNGQLGPWIGEASAPQQSEFLALNGTLYRGPGPCSSTTWDYTDAVELGPWTRMSEPDRSSCRGSIRTVVIGGQVLTWDGDGQGFRAKVGGLLVSNVSPRIVSSRGGATVNVAGGNFRAGLSLRVGSEPVTPTRVNSRALTFVAPARPPGEVDLEFRNTDGELFTWRRASRDPFRYVDCDPTFGVSPTSFTMPGAGGTAVVHLAAAALDCTWQATSDQPWVRPSAASGSGSADVTLTVDPNTNPFVRGATVNIAGRSVTIQQLSGTGGGSGAPTGLTATATGNSVDVAWNPPATGPVAEYRLEVGSASQLADIVIASVAGTRLHADGVPARTYYLRVRAVTGGALSPASNEVVLVVGGCPAPPAPTGFTIIRSGAVLDLSWSAAAGALGYALRAGSGPGLSDLANLDVGAATSLRATAPSGRYFVRAHARNACGFSGPSNEVEIVVP